MVRVLVVLAVTLVVAMMNNIAEAAKPKKAKVLMMQVPENWLLLDLSPKDVRAAYSCHLHTRWTERGIAFHTYLNKNDDAVMCVFEPTCWDVVRRGGKTSKTELNCEQRCYQAHVPYGYSNAAASVYHFRLRRLESVITAGRLRYWVVRVDPMVSSDQGEYACLETSCSVNGVHKIKFAGGIQCFDSKLCYSPTRKVATTILPVDEMPTDVGFTIRSVD